MRTDLLKLLPLPNGGESRAVTVRNVEFQGSAVFVSLIAEDGLELSL